VVKLGDAVGELLNDRILPQAERFSSVAEAWKQLLPVNLAGHCRLTQVTAGQVKVVVDSAPYMYELQLCRSELLRELQRQCPGARLRKIELAIG
jgi:hypothetical protein